MLVAGFAQATRPATLAAMPTVSVRELQVDDIPTCVEIMRSNVPTFFTQHELEDFEAWVGTAKSPYLVIVRDDVVVGCGGYAIDRETGTASFTWGMIRSDLHRIGLGSLLLRERVARIVRDGHAGAIILDTSQHSRGFFERHGFLAVNETRDGYAPGLHRIDMRLDL